MDNNKFDISNCSKDLVAISKAGIDAVSKMTELECSDIDMLNKNYQDCFNANKKIIETSKNSEEIICAENKMESIINKQQNLVERKNDKRRVAKIVSIGLVLLPVVGLIASGLSQNKIGYKTPTKL